MDFPIHIPPQPDYDPLLIVVGLVVVLAATAVGLVILAHAVVAYSGWLKDQVINWRTRRRRGRVSRPGFPVIPHRSGIPRWRKFPTTPRTPPPGTTVAHCHQRLK